VVLLIYSSGGDVAVFYSCFGGYVYISDGCDSGNYGVVVGGGIQ